MNRLAVVAVATLAAGLFAGTPRGTVPRSEAARYPASVQRDGVAVGAIVLTPEQVKRAFASDISRCCIVVEVAVYPEKDKPLDVSLGDFTLRVPGTDTAARPSSARTLAAVLQKTAPSQRDITVYPSVGIGYETGPRVYDPVTGETRGGGVRTSAGVGVGVGDSRPASTDRDRDVMEMELGDKGLPEGTASQPVSGYLYFQLPLKKKSYELEYTLKGNKVVLPLR